MPSETKIEFAWLPKKLSDGSWVWLKHYEHKIVTKSTPTMSFLFDKEYRETCWKNMLDKENNNAAKTTA